MLNTNQQISLTALYIKNIVKIHILTSDTHTNTHSFPPTYTHTHAHTHTHTRTHTHTHTHAHTYRLKDIAYVHRPFKLHQHYIKTV